jgi:hypothetical protein
MNRGAGICFRINTVSKGSTPVLSSEEATALLTGMDVSTVVAWLSEPLPRIEHIRALSAGRLHFAIKKLYSKPINGHTSANQRGSVVA